MRCCAISFCLFHGIYFTNRCLYCSLFFRNLFIRTNALTFFALNTTKLHVAFLYNIRHLHIWCGYSFAIVFTDFLIRFFQNYIAHFNEGVQGFTHLFGFYTFNVFLHFWIFWKQFFEWPNSMLLMLAQKFMFNCTSFMTILVPALQTTVYVMQGAQTYSYQEVHSNKTS